MVHRIVALLGLVACGRMDAAVSPVDGDTGASAPDTGSTRAAPDADGADGADGADAPCTPVVSGLGENYVEGDEITFEVGCAEGAADGVRFLVRGATDADADGDAADGRWTWQTDGASGSRADLEVVAIRGGLAVAGAGTWPVWVLDDPDAPGAEPPDPERYDEELGLPVVHIVTDRAITQEDTPATFTVRGETVEGEVNIRGATSTTYPKKSYTLDFDSGELAVEEWGPRSRGHMLLISTFDDNSYVRQKLCFDLWAEMARTADGPRLAPRTFFAVVYINGVYQGLYLASDRPDDELARHMGFGDGEGDLYKAVTHDANYDRLDEHGAPKQDLAAGWEKKEGADRDDRTGIADLTAFVADADTGHFAEEARWRIDLDSYRDWHLLVMGAFAEDSAGKNHYAYRDEDSGRFVAMPWDFNASWGQSWLTKRRDPAQLRRHTDDNRVFRLMLEEERSVDALAARYAELADGGPLDPAWQRARIDAYYDAIWPSVERDWARWGEEYRAFERWRGVRSQADDWTDPAGERAFLEAWIDARAPHMAAWVAAAEDDVASHDDEDDQGEDEE